MGRAIAESVESFTFPGAHRESQRRCKVIPEITHPFFYQSRPKKEKKKSNGVLKNRLTIEFQSFFFLDSSSSTHSQTTFASVSRALSPLSPTHNPRPFLGLTNLLLPLTSPPSSSVSPPAAATARRPHGRTFSTKPNKFTYSPHDSQPVRQLSNPANTHTAPQPCCTTKPFVLLTSTTTPQSTPFNYNDHGRSRYRFRQCYRPTP